MYNSTYQRNSGHSHFYTNPIGLNIIRSITYSDVADVTLKLISPNNIRITLRVLPSLIETPREERNTNWVGQNIRLGNSIGRTVYVGREI